MRKLPLPPLAAALALSLVAGAPSAQFSNVCSVADSLSDVGSFRPLPTFPSDAGTATTNPQPLRTSWLAQRYGLVSKSANQGREDCAEVGASRGVGRVTGYRSASAAASKSEGDFHDEVTPGVRFLIA
jgi:hypothetical protein